MSTQNIQIQGSAFDAVSGHKLKSTSAGAVTTAIDYIKWAVAEFIRYRAFRAAERKLNALDDRMLKDIGLDRSEIRSALLNARHERLNGTQFPQTPFC
jgi:uncharacterized protein YjiS (DUF1127 family)